MKIVIYNAVLIAAQEGGEGRFDMSPGKASENEKQRYGWNSFVCPSSNRVFLFESDMTQKEMLQAKIPIRIRYRHKMC